MTQNKRLITTFIGLLLLSSSSLATPAPTSPNVDITENSSNSSNDELQKIIDDFNKYVSGIPANIREEVKKYRFEVAKINNQKRELYRKISQEAQKYLAKEQEYKKRISSLKKNTTEHNENNRSDKGTNKSQ